MATEMESKLGATDTTGVEDVTRSLRAVLRATRNVGEASADVVEREVSLAIRISEDIRDRIVTDEMLAEARNEPLMARLRSDTHRAVDLFADATSVVYVNGLRFLESFADERRPDIDSVQRLVADQRQS